MPMCKVYSISVESVIAVSLGNEGANDQGDGEDY